MKNKTKTHQETEKTIYQKHSNHEKRYEKIHENRRFSFRPFEAMISISCEEVTKEPCNEFRGVEWSLSEKQSRGKSLRFFWLRLWSNGMAVVWLWVKYIQISFRFSIFSYILQVRSWHFHMRHPQNSVSDGKVPVLCSLCAWLGSSRRHVPSTNAARP